MLFPDAPATLRIPFTYTVAYRARSWVSDRQCNFASEVVVEVPAATEQNAPVAFRLMDRGVRANRGLFAPKADGSPRAVRWHGDRFYIEWGRLDDLAAVLSGKQGAEATPFCDVVRTHAFHADPGAMNSVRFGRRSGHQAPAGVQDEKSLRRLESGMRYIRDDGGEAVAATIRRCASNCLVVGDAIYEAIAEPVLALNAVYVRDGSRTLTLQTSTHAVESASHSGQPDGDPSYAERLYPIDTDPASLDADTQAHVEVVRPDLVLYRRRAGHVVAEVAKIHKGISEHARELPAEMMVLVAELGRVLAGAPPEPTPDLATAVKAFAEAPGIAAGSVERMLRIARRFDGKPGWATERAFTRAMREFEAAAANLAALVDEVSDGIPPIPFHGRLDPSTCTVGGSSRNEWAEGWRLRQARSREDLRRAAVCLGLSLDDLERRMEGDPDMDVVLVERACHYRGISPGADLRMEGAFIADLAEGALQLPSGTPDELRELAWAHFEEAGAARLAAGRRP